MSIICVPGLEYLYRMTQSMPYKLRLTMTDQNGVKAEANYASFRVESEDHDYKLHLGPWLERKYLILQ